MSGSQRSSQIVIGMVGKPHGVHGGFHVVDAIDAAALVSGLNVAIGAATYAITQRSGGDSRPIVMLEGVDDRDGAASLRGREIVAERSDLAPLSEGEWYGADLQGLAVVTGSGRQLGNVVRLQNLPSVDVLELDGEVPDAGLIPMVEAAILSIDLAAGVITVDGEFLNLDQDITAS